MCLFIFFFFLSNSVPGTYYTVNKSWKKQSDLSGIRKKLWTTDMVGLPYPPEPPG